MQLASILEARNHSPPNPSFRQTVTGVGMTVVTSPLLFRFHSLSPLYPPGTDSPNVTKASLYMVYNGIKFSDTPDLATESPRLFTAGDGKDKKHGQNTIQDKKGGIPTYGSSHLHRTAGR